MDFTVPDKISPDFLQGMLDRAEELEESEAMFDGFTQSELESLASDALDSVTGKCKNPMVLKIMTLMILNKFIAWHDMSGEHMMHCPDATDSSVASWFKDSGSLVAAGMIITQISVDDNDFTTPVEV